MPRETKPTSKLGRLKTWFYGSREAFPERAGLRQSRQNYLQNPTQETEKAFLHRFSRIALSWLKQDKYQKKLLRQMKTLSETQQKELPIDALHDEFVELMTVAIDQDISTFSAVNSFINSLRAKIRAEQRQKAREIYRAHPHLFPEEGYSPYSEEAVKRDRWNRYVGMELEFAVDRGFLNSYGFYLVLAKRNGYYISEAAEKIGVNPDTALRYWERTILPRVRAILAGEEVSKMEEETRGRPLLVDPVRLEKAILQIIT